MLLAVGRARHTIQFVGWLKVKEMTKMRGEMADCCIWYGALVYLEGSEAKYWILLGSLCERARSLGANWLGVCLVRKRAQCISNFDSLDKWVRNHPIPSCVSLGKWERLEHDCVLGKRAFVVCFYVCFRRATLYLQERRERYSARRVKT